jgi:hypothetical protein
MFIIMLVYFFFFFFGGVLCRAFIALGSRCYAHSFFSMGAYIFLFLLLLLYIFFFENHGLGLGTALFRLGTRVSPAMQKHFNLPWKFFQMVVENWGLKLVKPQLGNQTWFGNSSKRSGKNWDLTLSQIAIGWSDPVWKFIQTIGDKLGFDTCQIAIG